MRRLAMGAVLGVIAFASPVDSGSSGATTHHRPVRRVETSAALAAQAAPAAEQPSAEDDEQAMRDAALAISRARATRSRATRSRSDVAVRAAGGGVWAALAACESHGNPRAVSSSGKYRGAFQFSIASWRSLGHGGDPIDHPYATQLEAAKRLQARSGWSQWPTCARRLGLI